jgi:hypothetical protein
VIKNGSKNTQIRIFAKIREFRRSFAGTISSRSSQTGILQTIKLLRFRSLVVSPDFGRCQHWCSLMFSNTGKSLAGKTAFLHLIGRKLLFGFAETRLRPFET